MRLHFQDVIANDQGQAGNAEYLDSAHRRGRTGRVRVVSNGPGWHANAADLSAVEIQNCAIAQVVGDHEREVVDEKIPVEMCAKIIGGWTASEGRVDGRISSRSRRVTK